MDAQYGFQRVGFSATTGLGIERLDQPQQANPGHNLIHLDDTYAAGYALSKWASEVLLREAHSHYGLPVTTFRSSMILAHSKYPGQLNVPDMFTRLLLSIALTGIAPSSILSIHRQHWAAIITMVCRLTSLPPRY
ncbi:hypothetical protein F3K50_17200 [Pseudomonas marginalis]|nr:hypothetical protein F3K50_17200 [Pseudomonas marginalis]